MDPIIKQYLQEHKHQLNDLEEFFDGVFDSILSNDSIIEMCSYMASAGIENINDYRDKSLNKILKMYIDEFGTSHDPDIALIFIPDFIDMYLDNRLGYSVYYVQQYMLKHAIDWEHLVNIYVDENKIPVIERKN